MTFRFTSPHLQAMPDQLVDAWGLLGQEVQRLVEEGIDRVVLLAQDLGVVGVGGQCP